MIGLNSFDELAETIADYAHREELLDRIKQLFIPLAGVRIGRDLKSSANEYTEILDGAALGDPMLLPANFSEIRSLTWLSTRQPFPLEARDNTAINLVPNQGGEPFAYNIQDGAIRVRPFVSSEYELNYYGIPALSEAQQTDPVLARHPQIYLYGALVELQIWTQDATQRDLALSAYRGEIEVTNRNERRARFNAPASVGV